MNLIRANAACASFAGPGLSHPCHEGATDQSVVFCLMPLFAIALSGGIDSLAAASLLMEQGHNPVGIHFTTGFETVSADEVVQAGKRLGIRTEILDCAKQFRAKVVDNFLRTYQSGQTPNPCQICNAVVKFGIRVLARKLGADRFATGHYARVRQNPDGRHSLLKGADLQKDQSYFLAFLNQEQPVVCGFPLGNSEQTGVRRLAEEKAVCSQCRKKVRISASFGSLYREFLEKTAGGIAP
ncbi:MAG: hypothetical protein R2941_14945 [Desulfobacterales bacterium]